MNYCTFSIAPISWTAWTSWRIEEVAFVFEVHFQKSTLNSGKELKRLFLYLRSSILKKSTLLHYILWNCYPNTPWTVQTEPPRKHNSSTSTLSLSRHHPQQFPHQHQTLVHPPPQIHPPNCEAISSMQESVFTINYRDSKPHDTGASSELSLTLSTFIISFSS